MHPLDLKDGAALKEHHSKGKPGHERIRRLDGWLGTGGSWLAQPQPVVGNNKARENKARENRRPQLELSLQALVEQNSPVDLGVQTKLPRRKKAAVPVVVRPLSLLPGAPHPTQKNEGDKSRKANHLWACRSISNASTENREVDRGVEQKKCRATTAKSPPIRHITCFCFLLVGSASLSSLSAYVQCFFRVNPSSILSINVHVVPT